MVTVTDAIVCALVSGAFFWGVAWATNTRKVRDALRLARAAHRRLNELENQTGNHCTLREEDL